jgi:hypothetical protein
MNKTKQHDRSIAMMIREDKVKQPWRESCGKKLDRIRREEDPISFVLCTTLWGHEWRWWDIIMMMTRDND